MSNKNNQATYTILYILYFCCIDTKKINHIATSVGYRCVEQKQKKVHIAIYTIRAMSLFPLHRYTKVHIATYTKTFDSHRYATHSMGPDMFLYR